MITASIEELRGEQYGVSVLALAADGQEHQAAKVALGLVPEVEPDGPPPSCGWCGSSSPPGGLEDQSMGGPPVHECVDSADCQGARQAAEPVWLDKQFRAWPIDWHKYQEIQQYQAEQAARSRWGGGIYQLSEDVDPEFALALAHVRDAVDRQAVPDAEAIVTEFALTAARGPGPATPQAVPQVPRFDPWGHTLAADRNRTHLLGHHRQHKGVTDAASALARKNQQRLRGLRAD